MHTFLHLSFFAADRLCAEVFGVRGDGSPPVILDTFEYTTTTCPAP